MCNNAETRQFRITYILKEPNSKSIQNNGDIESIGKQSVVYDTEMRQFRITYPLKERYDGDIEGICENNQCVTMLR